MADTLDTQLVVLGAGPGGYAAAFLAANKGLKVTLIDATPRLGGTCLQVGCIPSKALLHTAKLIFEAREGPHFGVTFGPPKIDLNGVRGHWQKVVDKMTGNLAGLAKARKVDVVTGRGRFVDERTVEIEGGKRYRFEHCVLATGSSPVRPPVFNLPSSKVMD